MVRGELVESRHRGHLVVLSPAGDVVLEAGQPLELVYPRSSLKPAQSVAMLRHGAGLSGRRLALSAASHSGETGHQQEVTAMLADLGLTGSALVCPPSWPLAGEHGVAPSRIAHNCSGKHAGMLTACVAAGQDSAGYADTGHPFQQRIRDTAAELAGTDLGPATVDGCGAPLLSMPLVGLARLFAALARATTGAEHEVTAAMRAHPWWVGGTGRDVTALLVAVPGLLTKDGAEGVYAAALPSGAAVAVKIDDGGQRARVPVLLAALELVGADLSRVEPQLRRPPVLGGGLPVGELRPMLARR